jgi:hypothetical protein
MEADRANVFACQIFLRLLKVQLAANRALEIENWGADWKPGWCAVLFETSRRNEALQATLKALQEANLIEWSSIGWFDDDEGVWRTALPWGSKPGVAFEVLYTPGKRMGTFDELCRAEVEKEGKASWPEDSQ